MNYDEFSNNSDMKNEKSSARKRLAKSKRKRLNLKLDQFNKEEYERKELQKSHIKKNMNKFVAGFSEYD